MLANQERQGRGILLLLRCAAVLPPLVAAAVLARFAVDIPCQDDYSAILAFCLGFQRLSTPSSRVLYLISSQHTDYKLIFEHGVVLLQLTALGHLNFLLLIALGNVFLLGICVLVWRMFYPEQKSLRRRLLLFLPASVLLFSLNYSETLDWAMAGLQNLPVIFFSLGALFFLFGGEAPDGRWPIAETSQTRFLLACIAAFLASLSSANGFLLAPIGLLAFLVRRRSLRAALWGLVFVPPLAAYLYRYQVVLPAMKVHVYTKPLFAVAILGDAAPPGLVLPLGLFLLLVWGWLLRERTWAVPPFAAAVSIWIIETAVLIAMGRGNYGFGASYASRYKIYSDLFLIVLYGSLLRLVERSDMAGLRKRQLYTATLVVSIVYCAFADLSAWRLLRQREADLRFGLAAYRADPARNSPMYLSDPILERSQAAADEAARRIMNEAIAAGLYRPPGSEIAAGSAKR